MSTGIYKKGNDLKILLISYFFPPYKKVGGRRWAKHIKYMKRMGINVHVLCKKFSGTSSWDKDTLGYKNDITRLEIPEMKIPFHKRHLPKNIPEKIRWKLSYWAHRIFSFEKEKALHDESENTGTYFFNAAEKIILEKSINVIILSIGPYMYSEVLPKIRSKFPNIKIVLDDRDYWDEFIDRLTEEQRVFHKKFQSEVINSVDLILNPYIEMKLRYERLFNKEVVWLPHCFDADDIPEYKPYTTASTIKIIYGGAFYDKIGDGIEIFKKCIDGLAMKKEVEADFYVSVKGYEKELDHPCIKRHDFIDSEAFFSKVQNSDYVVLILPPNRSNSMSSKFFELVALYKPILYFGTEGEVSEYLIKNKLGYHITAQNVDLLWDEIYNNTFTQIIPDMNTDISKHTFAYQTKLLLDELL